jgi:hypothetical protein
MRRARDSSRLQAMWTVTTCVVCRRRGYPFKAGSRIRLEARPCRRLTFVQTRKAIDPQEIPHENAHS